MASQGAMAVQIVKDHPASVLRRIVSRAATFWIGGEEIEWRPSWVYRLFHAGALVRHILYSLPALLGLAGLILLYRSRKHRVVFATLATIFILFPLPYYVSLTQPRYRAPIEPFLVILSVFGLLSLQKNRAAFSLGQPRVGAQTAAIPAS
jgi:hypothetical protein